MNRGKNLIYMFLGGVIALALVFGGVAAFAAQTDDAATPTAQSDGTVDAVTRLFRVHGERRLARQASDKAQALADALGITLDDLNAAHEQVRTAAIEQAVADGLLTQEQADALLANGAPAWRGFRMGDEAEQEAALAEALGITADELQAAQDQVFADELAARVGAGVITQEQADMIAAQRAVQGYVDRAGIEAYIQSAHETAIAAALADGVITQEQADTLLESLSSGMRGFGLEGFGGRGGRGHGHGHGGPGRGFPGGDGSFAPFQGVPSTTDTGIDA